MSQYASRRVAHPQAFRPRHRFALLVEQRVAGDNAVFVYLRKVRRAVGVLQNFARLAAQDGNFLSATIRVTDEQVFGVFIARGEAQHRHLARRADPASYTHLDVYKRQGVKSDVSIRMNIDRLRQDLVKAIAAEEYEEAARLRDQIRALKQQLEPAEKADSAQSAGGEGETDHD